MSASPYPCPCCGALTRSESGFGTYDICPVCYWENDPVQAVDPDLRGGANHVSLNEARKSYREIGACDLPYVNLVRPPRDGEAPATS